MATTILKNENTISNDATINVFENDRILATYDDDGTKNNFMFPLKNIGGTIRAIGGVDDVFKIQTNIAGEWADYYSHTAGKISDLTISGKTSGIRLVITTNTSGSIKLEILL